MYISAVQFFLFIMNKLILDIFGPALSFIYEKINSNSIFKAISSRFKPGWNNIFRNKLFTDF